jgi:hypothetical protein
VPIRYDMVVFQYKKLIFLIAPLIFSVTTLAQRVALNDGVSIEIPVGAEQITKEKALAHVGKKFNNDKMTLRSITNIHARYIYKVDDVLVSLVVFDTPVKVNATHLSELKRGMDAMSAGSNSHYTSILKKVNNNSILIVNYLAGKVGYYHFYCYNDNNTREITGVLHYHVDDAAEATTVLDNLLDSVKFKD